MSSRDSRSDAPVEESFFGYRVLRKASAADLVPICRALIRRLSPDNVPEPSPREGEMLLPFVPIRVSADGNADDFCDVKLFHDGRCRCWLVVYRGKKYVLKLDKRDRHRFDYLAQSFFFGSNSFRLMRALNEAFSRGFRGAPELFLVADSRRFGCTLHSFFLREYVAGRTMFDVPPEVLEARRDEAKRIVRTLHAFGVTHGDAHPGNFILDEESGRLKVIDAGGKMPTAIQKATDRIRMEKEWGIPNDVRDWGWALARLHVMRRHFLKRLRKTFS
ncbi:MAG: lipopolysaccharide core heptose(II) kinase RfaY [Candidatus Spyradosoma sp.]